MMFKIIKNLSPPALTGGSILLFLESAVFVVVVFVVVLHSPLE